MRLCWSYFLRSIVGNLITIYFGGSDKGTIAHQSTHDRRVTVSVWQVSVKFGRYSRTDACVDFDPETQCKDLVLVQYTDISLFRDYYKDQLVKKFVKKFTFLMGIPVLVKRYLYIEMVPRYFPQRQTLFRSNSEQYLINIWNLYRNSTKLWAKHGTDKVNMVLLILADSDDIIAIQIVIFGQKWLNISAYLLQLDLWHSNLLAVGCLGDYIWWMGS